MKKFTCFALILLFCSAVLAQETKTEKYLSIVKTPTKVPVLKVEYPCHLHKDASLEIRVMMPETEADHSLTKPLYFEERWLQRHTKDGVRVRDAVEDCYLNADTEYLTRELELFDPDADTLILGWTNVFEKREVAVLVRMENPRVGEEEITLAFPCASHCRVGIAPSVKAPFNADAFGFELAGEVFQKPCKLRVWLLSGETFLFEEDILWPGFGAILGDEAGENADSGDEEEEDEGSEYFEDEDLEEEESEE